MKTAIALALALSACTAEDHDLLSIDLPPMDMKTLGHEVDLSDLPPTVGKHLPLPDCLVGTWAYTLAYLPGGTCDSPEFQAAIEALPDESYPGQCFALPVNGPSLFGTMGQFEINADGTVYGVQSVTPHEDCTAEINFVVGPMRDVCGEYRTVSWDVNLNPNGLAWITLLVEKEVNGQRVPYASCEQRAALVATHL